ncbi:carbohydrate-binding module family 14 protein [Streptomyces sp. NPDC004539]|uniref:carbohydrate-binding module family 14 protein n=1 Tax=Streptomyces sp. NPDC004539 TaxID=3154280 RepID=UPI0033AAB26D
MSIRTLRTTAAALACALPFLLGAAAPSSVLPVDYCAGAPDANYSHPGWDRPELYVECLNGASRVDSCPSGLVYNPRPRPLGMCDWPASTDPTLKVYPPNYQP